MYCFRRLLNVPYSTKHVTSYGCNKRLWRTRSIIIAYISEKIFLYEMYTRIECTPLCPGNNSRSTFSDKINREFSCSLHIFEMSYCQKEIAFKRVSINVIKRQMCIRIVGRRRCCESRRTCNVTFPCSFSLSIVQFGFKSIIRLSKLYLI